MGFFWGRDLQATSKTATWGVQALAARQHRNKQPRFLFGEKNWNLTSDTPLWALYVFYLGLAIH